MFSNTRTEIFYWIPDEKKKKIQQQQQQKKKQNKKKNKKKTKKKKNKQKKQMTNVVWNLAPKELNSLLLLLFLFICLFCFQRNVHMCGRIPFSISGLHEVSTVFLKGSSANLNDL